MARALRILVVDDDPAMVGAITALVGTEGHQVITAYDGLTAVRRYREEHPDLVLLDLALPDIDGEQVLADLRADPATQAIPVVVVTGDSEPDVQHRVLGHGAQGCLIKPFEVMDLLRVVDRFLRTAA